jgi:tetratricopeptide (TPR) repeat protein
VMEAFVSGVAARAAFVQGTDVFYINAFEPKKKINSDISEIKRIFLGATDVEKCTVKSVEDVFPLLLKKYNFDRGLSLLDVALGDDCKDFQIEAAELFELLIEDLPSFELIRNYVFATNNENLPLYDGLFMFRKVAPHFTAFIEEAIEAQPFCMQFRIALNKAFKALGIDSNQSSLFLRKAVDTGAFRALVETKGNIELVNSAVLKCYQLLKDIPNARQIIQAWTQGIAIRKTRTELVKLERVYEKYESSSYSPTSAQDRTSYEVYRNVQQQKDAILNRMRAGDVNSARRFASQLIESQTQNGEAEYAAKSLSSIAMEARKLGLHSLELDWAEKSVALMPEDGKGVGVLADTYLRLLRVPQAEDAFKRAIGLGEEEFGISGLARVLRVCGKFDEALQAFSSAIVKFADRGLSPETLSAQAETLRDMWREEEALSAYEAALKRHPNESALLCGKAAVLASLGKLSDAASLYETVTNNFPENSTAWCGIAHVMIIEGRFENALAIYKQTLEKFPDSVIAYCGYAYALRSNGELQEALDAYRIAKTRFPYSPSPVNGEAETLRDMGNVTEALSLLKDAQDIFPLDPRLRNSYAVALKQDGQFAEALKEFDKNVKEFPYDLFSLGGRANLLKLLGQYNEALDAYDVIIARRPDYQMAQNAKAAILVAIGQFEEAETLLTTISPTTEVEWGTLHIQGMSLLRQEKIKEAKVLFEKGLECPFYRQRAFFVSSLAVINIRVGDLNSTSKTIFSHHDNVSKFLSIHMLFKLNQRENAEQRFIAMNDNMPQPLLELRNRMRLMLDQPLPVRSDLERDIFDREIEMILQAA